MKNFMRFTLLLVLFFLALTACTPFTRAVGGVPTDVIDATPQPSNPQTTSREAQVLRVEIQYSQADPRQVSAIVHGNLSDSCSTLQDPQVSYEAGTFNISLMVVSPTDRGCIQVITPFEQTITLETASLAPGTYSVIANGVSANFNYPAEAADPLTSFQLVVSATDGSIHVVDASAPLNPASQPFFHSFLPAGGAITGVAYVLDTNQDKAIVIDSTGMHDLIFVQLPTTYGLAVWPGDEHSRPMLAWATRISGLNDSSTIKISNTDGGQFETLLTQDSSNPPSQLMVQFWSPDGQWIYFSKEPVGIGGYILFSGASNLYKINVVTKEVVDILPQEGPDSQQQACLDAMSADYRYSAEHCSQNFIRVRDLASGGTLNYNPPSDIASGNQLTGSARFSPDGKKLAYAVAKGFQDNEQGWVVVTDTAIDNSKVILTSQAGSYYTVAGWLDDQTLLVQSANLQECSPYCSSELFAVDADGSNQQKVADGSFLTLVPNGGISSPLPNPTSTPGSTVCTNAAEYIGDDGLDGTSYTPNTAFTKTWKVKNTGTCTWDSQYLVYQVSGALMTQQPGYWLVRQGQTVVPGQTVDVSVGMSSPSENGVYRADWVLKDADGKVIPLKGGTDENSIYVEIKVSDDTDKGKVTASTIDISLEQGSGEQCTADATYFVHAYISTDGPATVPYEIGSSAGQISAGFFEDENGQYPYITGELTFDKGGTKQINLRFVGPYPYPKDITVMLRVDGGEWYSTKLFCP